MFDLISKTQQSLGNKIKLSTRSANSRALASVPVGEPTVSSTVLNGKIFTKIKAEFEKKEMINVKNQLAE